MIISLCISLSIVLAKGLELNNSHIVATWVTVLIGVVRFSFSVFSKSGACLIVTVACQNKFPFHRTSLFYQMVLLFLHCNHLLLIFPVLAIIISRLC